MNSTETLRYFVAKPLSERVHARTLNIEEKEEEEEVWKRVSIVRMQEAKGVDREKKVAEEDFALRVISRPWRTTE